MHHKYHEISLLHLRKIDRSLLRDRLFLSVVYFCLFLLRERELSDLFSVFTLLLKQNIYVNSKYLKIIIFFLNRLYRAATWC